MASKKKKSTSKTAARGRKKEFRLSEKTVNRIFWAFRILLVVTVLVYIVYRVSLNNTWLKTHTTAVTVGDEKLTPADYHFYFYRSFYEYKNNAGDVASSLGGMPDETKPLYAQPLFAGSEETWQDYFNERTDLLIRRTYYYYNEAQKAGYELTEREEEELAYDFDEKIWFEADQLQGIPIDEYLEQHYGKGMTEEIYKKNLRILFTANAYMDYCTRNIEIDQDELEAYCEENAAGYDLVTYRLFYLGGGAADDPERDAKMNKAHELAEEFAGKVSSEKDFISLAEEYAAYNDESSYWQGASVEYTDQVRYARSYFRDWLAEEDRKAGDVSVAEASNGYYVAMFISREGSDYKTVNLRYFTVSGNEAEAEADAFLASFKESDRTAESFFDLSSDVRDIDYSVRYQYIDSITYTECTLSQVPEAIREWCFDSDRKAKDTAAIRDEEEDKVYVIYFDGYGDTARYSMARKEMKEAVVSEQNEAAQQQMKLRHNFFFYLTAK